MCLCLLKVGALSEIRKSIIIVQILEPYERKKNLENWKSTLS